MTTAEPIDREANVLCYREAAAQGHAWARFNLGLAYSLGRGVERDDAEAVNWFRMAADQGHARAAWELGMRYLIGLGVEHSKDTAYFWLSLGVRNGIKNLWLRAFRHGVGLFLKRKSRIEIRQRVQEWRISSPLRKPD